MITLLIKNYFTEFRIIFLEIVVLNINTLQLTIQNCNFDY